MTDKNKIVEVWAKQIRALKEQTHREDEERA